MKAIDGTLFVVPAPARQGCHSAVQLRGNRMLNAQFTNLILGEIYLAKRTADGVKRVWTYLCEVRR